LSTKLSMLEQRDKSLLLILLEGRRRKFEGKGRKGPHLTDSKALRPAYVS